MFQDEKWSKCLTHTFDTATWTHTELHNVHVRYRQQFIQQTETGQQEGGRREQKKKKRKHYISSSDAEPPGVTAVTTTGSHSDGGRLTSSNTQPPPLKEHSVNTCSTTSSLTTLIYIKSSSSAPCWLNITHYYQQSEDKQNVIFEVNTIKSCWLYSREQVRWF